MFKETKLEKLKDVSTVIDNNKFLRERLQVEKKSERNVLRAL